MSSLLPRPPYPAEAPIGRKINCRLERTPQREEEEGSRPRFNHPFPIPRTNRMRSYTNGPGWGGEEQHEIGGMDVFSPTRSSSWKHAGMDGKTAIYVVLVANATAF